MSTGAVTPPRVSVIVVSYQVRELLAACLASLARQRDIEVETIVVDNASTDGSPEMVEERFQNVRLIRNAENVGFARANNQALAIATGDWLALVNPDTELPADALRAVVSVFARRGDKCGAVGLPLHHSDGRPQAACFSFPDPLNLLVEALALHRVLVHVGFGSPSLAPVPRGGEGRVDWVQGAFMVLSRSAYRAVGGLEPSLFLFGEEMDWSWRARARGFQTVMAAGPSVLHHGGASGIGSEGILFARNVEARVAFLARHRGPGLAVAGRAALRLGVGLRLWYWLLRRRLESAAGRVGARTQLQIDRYRAAADRLGTRS